MTSTNCRYCQREVVWRESKQGKRYLAERAEIRGAETGRVIKVIYPSHQCPVSDPADRARIVAEAAAAHENAIRNGEMVKGQTVVVSKGRKYPIGTVGTLKWVAPNPDIYGVVKACICTADGTEIWINIANLTAQPTEPSTNKENQNV